MELSLILKRVWRGRRILRYILHSVFFNFHYLPFHEAVKLPILLYKPKLLKLKGTIKIKQEDKIGFGMIRLGFPEVSLYPNTGIVFENYGGTVVLKDNVVLETIHTFLLDLKPLWNLVIDFQLPLRFG